MESDAGVTDRVRVVEADLNFLLPMAEKPRQYNYDPPPGTPAQNYRSIAHRVAIRDLRPDEDAAQLDREGFAVLRHESAEREFTDEERIRDVAYPESASLVARAPGAARVVILDHTIRRRVPGAPDRGAVGRQPVARVHVDQTEFSGPDRVRLHFPDEADALLRGRVRVVNLWRPIRGPVLDQPLALCDARSVSPGDLVATDLLYPDRRGETYSVLFNPAQRWHYLSAMRTDEALLLKCYDSDRTVAGRFMPHTAFADPTTPADAPPRQSIELRALVFG